MSTWKIYRTVSGTAQEIAECVSLEFHDIWMGEEFVTVSITSPTPVELQVGDYLTYRGATYTIYSLPTALKTARINSYGEAFKYDGVKLSARSTELTDIRFLDIVLGDNNLHYTSLPTFSVYCQTVDDLVDRLQANTDRNGIQWFFITPSYSRTMQRYTGTAAVTAEALWHQYYDNADNPSQGNTEINISVDKMSVWDGLAFIKNNFGLNFITRDRACIVGAPGVIADHIFRYGKGNGLHEIERTADTDQQIVTKLFAYGSDKNLPLRYYATIGNDMPNNMAVNVLMLPGFPQYSLSQLCRLTYYTDGTGSRHTKVQIRKTPSASYSDIMDILGEYTIGFSDNKLRPYITSGNVSTLGVKEGDIHFTEENDDNGLQEVYPSIEGMTAGDAGVSGLPADERLDEIKACDVIDDNGVFEEGAEIPNFNIYLKPLGFDLKQAYDANGGTMVIHLNDGYCGGRDFSVKSVEWEEANSRWKLNVERHHDESLDLYFPYSWGKSTGGSSSANEAYQIRTGDHFVLTEIEISDTSYIWAASVKALRKAVTWLLNNDYTRFTYLPKVDEIFMARQHDSSTPGTSLHDTLKAGDVMNFEDSDLDIAGNVFIDTLTIKENGNNGIPTYDVVLRNDKQVGTMQRIQNQLNTLSSFVTGGGGGLSIAQIRQLIQTYGAGLFLSKLNDDTAQGLLNFLSGFVANERAQFNDNVDFGDFVQGLVGGQGARMDPNGNMEAESLYLRSELIVPKLTYNHVDVRVGDEWQTNGGGEIDYVDGFFTDTDGIEGGVIHLRLQKDDEGNVVEYGTVRLNDLCKGIFHNLNGYNDTQTSDDGKGRRTFSGFYTSYFQCISVSDDSDHYATITYKLRPTITIGGVEYWLGDDGQSTGVRGGFHPCANMTFAQYANTDQNSNRRNCQYRTTTYMRMLANMGGWDEGLANIAFQIGNTPLIASAFPSDPRASQAGSYSMWINGDIFFSGTLNRVDAWDRDIIEYPDQGDYVPATTYHLNDLVHHDGIVWRCVKNTITGEAPGSNTQDPAWVKWIYADSVEPMGRWDSAKVPYPAKAVVNLLNGVYMSKRSTSQPPLGLRTTKTGKYITKADGGYIVFDNTLQEDWELLIDIGDITNGEDGENSISINLTNDTDSVLTDEKGNIAESLPTTTAELYDGLNKVVEGVVWSIQSTTGCTASINATTGVCQVLTMTASNAEVIIIATYKQKVYGKKFTFKKLYGKDKLWLDMPEVVYFDNPTAKNINPTSLTIKAYITSITEGEAKPINGSMGKGYVKVGSSSNRYYHGDVVNINYDSFANGHLLINLYDSSDDIQDTEDIRLIQEPETLGSGGRWTTSTQVRKNFIYRFGNKTYIALQDSVNIPPVMSILRKKNGGAITTKNGYYIITDNNTNTEYYDVVSEDGDDAVTYELTVSPDSFNRYNNGNFKDSSVVTCNVFKIVGSTRTQLNNTTFTSEGLSFAPLINGEANSFISWSSNAFKGTIPTTANTVKIQIKKSNTVIISKDITFSFDGREGCMTRVSEWKASTSSETVTYHNDEAASSSQVSTAYIDVVALPTSSSLYPEGYIFYSCKQTHNSSNSNKPGTTGGSNYWTQLSNVGPIYTSLLIAKNAFIKFGTGNQFLIIDANNKIQAGMKGSGDDGETNPIRIWAGGDNINTASDAALANVPFRVYKDGKFCATNAEISGNITATSGSLGGFTIGETLLYNTNYNASISVKDKASNPTQVVVIGKDASDAYTGSSYKCSMQAEAIGTGTYNTALYLNAQNGSYNYAFHGNGNGVLNGFMAGFRPQIVTIPSGSGDTNSSRIFIREGSFVVIKGSHTSGHVSVGMPTLTEIRRTLGIDSSTPFFFELNVISYSTYEYVNLAFRGASGQSGSEYPVLMGYDDRPFPDGIGTRTSWQIAQGDYFKILLTYIQNTSGTLEYRAYVLQNLN